MPEHDGDLVELFIDETGAIQTIYDDDVTEALAELGPLTNERVSYVEPSVEYPGQWDIQFQGCPPLGPYKTRGEALAAEKRWVSRALAEGMSPALYMSVLE